MTDIETMGNGSRAAIVQIAAVECDINTGETGATFKENVSLASSLDAGLEVNASTILWWMEQSEDAKKAVFSYYKPLAEVLLEFRNWITMRGGRDVMIWGRSPRFDCGIIGDAYKALKQGIPWDFRNERCVRTIEAIDPAVKKAAVNTGVAHNGVDDCLYQIEYCSKIIQKHNLNF